MSGVKERFGGKEVLNQEALKRRRDRGGKGIDRKGDKADAKKESFSRDFSRMQFDKALSHVLDETATPEDLGFIDRFGRVLDMYTTERGTEVTITLVDFARGSEMDGKVVREKNINAA